MPLEEKIIRGDVLALRRLKCSAVKFSSIKTPTSSCRWSWLPRDTSSPFHFHHKSATLAAKRIRTHDFCYLLVAICSSFRLRLRFPISGAVTVLCSLDFLLSSPPFDSRPDPWLGECRSPHIASRYRPPVARKPPAGRRRPFGYTRVATSILIDIFTSYARPAPN